MMEFEVFNPNNKAVDQLPIIYGFNNGGSPGFMYAQLIAEDGTALGSHLCSSEGFMYRDLGIVKGSRPDRHEGFRAHYPDGYRMDFVPHDKVENHAGLNEAFRLNALMPDEAETHA